MPTDLSPSTLRPLPIRVTQRQYQRLVARRAWDQLSIQEHVRRALDFYLDDLDARSGTPPATSNAARPQQNDGDEPADGVGVAPLGNDEGGAAPQSGGAAGSRATVRTAASQEPAAVPVAPSPVSPKSAPKRPGKNAAGRRVSAAPSARLVLR